MTLNTSSADTGHFLQQIVFAALALTLSACTSLETPPAVPQTVPPELTQPQAVESEPASLNEIEPDQTGLTPELLYDILLSSIAFQAGEIEVSTDALIRAAEASGEPQIISRAVRMAVQSKRYAEALALGERWIEQSPDDQLAYIVTALAALMDGQSEFSFQTLQSLMTQDDSKISLYFQQFGEVFIQYADNPDAVTVSRQLAEAYPQKAQAWLVLAGIAQKNRDFKTMELAIDQILLIEPENQKAAEYKLLVLSEDVDEQQAFAVQFLARNPQADEFRLLYAKRLLQEQNNDAAIEQLLILLKHDKNDIEVIKLLALIYQSTENYKKAAQYFERQLELNPDDDRVRLYFASALQQLDRFDEAKVQLASVQGEEELFNAQRQMVLLIEQADGVEAALLYLDSLDGDDREKNILLITDREMMLKRADREADARAVINAGLERYPDEEVLLYHRALSWVELSDLKTHEADMRVLLALQPDNAHYNNTLGYSILTLSGRIEEAAIFIDKAHEVSPQDPYILDSKGWLEFKRGNLKASLEYLMQAFEIDQDAEIAAHIGEVYWVQGDQDKAREYWDIGDQIDPENKALKETRARLQNE